MESLEDEFSLFVFFSKTFLKKILDSHFLNETAGEFLKGSVKDFLIFKSLLEGIPGKKIHRGFSEKFHGHRR